MKRITDVQLESMIKRLNRVTGNAETPYVKRGEKYEAQVGCYHLSGAYGGVSLHQMDNKSGGVRDVFRCGHVPKRDLYNRISAFIDGLESK